MAVGLVPASGMSHAAQAADRLEHRRARGLRHDRARAMQRARVGGALARLLRQKLGLKVVVTNLAENGKTSEELLSEIRSDPMTRMR